MLLLPDTQLDARRAIARTSLEPLYDSLASELEPLVGKAPYVPEAKALLSRAGGRCERDGTTLDFDPWSPQEHRCPTCGTIHRGELHHRAWITSYQLWLSERGVHAALFHLLRGDARHAALARDILNAYADQYLRYPNRDNVLGPTRLFFSTYLESMWLLQICVAADLLRAAGDRRTAEAVCDRIVSPSRELIAEYDEGLSNRQVWNNAALLAAAAVLKDDRSLRATVYGDAGLEAHLARALLGDGTWYEGENYHQFALRGLWYAVTLCEVRGIPLDDELVRRFQRAFAAPFLTALPDFAMPSRKDSQYAVSLRQWRIAEITELGFARTRDPVLAGALARCYEAGHPQGETGRARSTADVERNRPSVALTRADLGWRALLHAVPSLPEVNAPAPRSALLEGQGLAVFRRADDVYVAMDFGQSGGGHGHPDRLNLTLSRGSHRVLDDLGTGSYVDPSLHWYRSTLAHNAPLINGSSQPLRDGSLCAYEEREALGWIVAELVDPQTGTRLERTLVVAPDYLIDEVRWMAPQSVRVELPLHLEARVDGRELAPAHLDGGNGLEDGFSFVRDVAAATVRAGEITALLHDANGAGVRGLVMCDREATLFSGCAPGQPTSVSRRFFVLRAAGNEGLFRTVLSWHAAEKPPEFAEDAITIHGHAGERHVHRRDRDGWHVELWAGGARSSIDLAGWRSIPDTRQYPLPAARNPSVLRRGPLRAGWLSEMPKSERSALLTFELGEAHYRRSEDRWKAAGAPHATVAIAAGNDALLILADIEAGDPRFSRADAQNALDNEHADTMGAGVQLYVRTPDGSGAWTLVPESPGDAVRVRAITGWGSLAAPAATWRARGAGYELRITLPLTSAVAAEYPVDVDVIVNETVAGRERRRGQLVLSGAQGEFVYLRGDRHDLTRLIPLVLVS